MGSQTVGPFSLSGAAIEWISWLVMDDMCLNLQLNSLSSTGRSIIPVCRPALLPMRPAESRVCGSLWMRRFTGETPQTFAKARLRNSSKP